MAVDKDAVFLACYRRFLDSSADASPRTRAKLAASERVSTRVGYWSLEHLERPLPQNGRWWIGAPQLAALDRIERAWGGGGLLGSWSIQDVRC
jgi:hypothetical protein